MIYWLLGLELVDGATLSVCGLIATALVVAVAAVRPRHPVRIAIGASSGALIAVLFVAGFTLFNTFGVAIPPLAAVWSGVALASGGVGVAGLWSAPWWRRTVAGALIVASLVVGMVGVNRTFAITHTLAAIIGVQAVGPVSLPPRTTAAPSASPLFASWTAPVGMPAKGIVGSLSGDDRIPSPGFAARDAAIYLPPAALVKNPPRLPLLVFMMGQPGSPEPVAIAKALDAFAGRHAGLAPIAIVADQLTSPTLDPACHDSATYGAVASYFNTSIPAYARARLNVIDDPAYRVIGGYSNGGACAALWGSQHPEIWGNLLDVSGNEFPGSESVPKTIATVFGGDTAAFVAANPAAVMAAAPPGAYAGHTAVFTSGSEDTQFGKGQHANAAAAQTAGFTVTFKTVPGATHVGTALDGGLALAMPVLGRALGLSPP